MSGRDILSLWRLPHPFIFKPTSYLLPAGVTVVLIFLLAPFNILANSTGNRFLFSIASGGIVALSIISVVNAFRRGMPKWSRHESWTVGKEIVLFITVLFVIVFFHFLLLLFIEKGPSVSELFSKVVLRTLGISILPVFALILFEQYNHRTQQLKRALQLTQAIRQRYAKDSTPKSSQSSDVIWLHNENGKPVCQVASSEVQYVKSDGNYIEVFTIDLQHNQRKYLVRNKLNHAESLFDKDEFIRVHRSYLANLNQVEKVRGNARNLELVFRTTEDIIPVSRSKATILMASIEAQ